MLSCPQQQVPHHSHPRPHRIQHQIRHLKNPDMQCPLDALDAERQPESHQRNPPQATPQRPSPPNATKADEGRKPERISERSMKTSYAGKSPGE